MLSTNTSGMKQSVSILSITHYQTTKENPLLWGVKTVDKNTTNSTFMQY